MWLFIYLIVILILLLLYFVFVRKLNYWEKLGVNGPKPNILSGSFPSLLDRKHNIIYDIDKIYQKYKKSDKFVGVHMVRDPQILILDPNLAHEIYVTKFKSFENNFASKMITPELDGFFNANPFVLTGKLWREKRSEITPALTPNRIQISYPIIQNVCEKMTEFLKEKVRTTNKNTPIDAKNLSNRYTAEVLADFSYGISAGSFDADDTPFLKASHEMVTDIVNAFTPRFIWALTPILSKFITAPFMTKATEQFFMDLMKRAMDLRTETKSDREDFLTYLLRLKEKKNLSEYDVTTNSMIIYIDGYETSATLISHCLLLLARNKPEQDILRREIEKNLEEDGKISFEKLSGLEYLDQCLHESLRIFSPILYASKLCTDHVELVNSNGKVFTPKIGETINIPVHCFHHDSEFYPEPEKFIPERFSEKNGGVKYYRDQGKFLAFGDGPRTCLGMKFGLFQSKAAICEIIKNFELSLDDRTSKDNTVDPLNFLAVLGGGVFLRFKEI